MIFQMTAGPCCL